MSEQAQIPNPQESDADEVRWALETARSLWVNDAREALRWLRRAAETASDVGDDLRSVQLARAAADLRTAANIQGSLPPPASLAPPPNVAAVQPAPAGNGVARPEEGGSDAAGSGAPGSHDAGVAEALTQESEASAAEDVASAALLAGQSATATPVWSPQSTPEPELEPEPTAAKAAPPPLPADFGAPPPAPPRAGPSQPARVAATAPALVPPPNVAPIQAAQPAAPPEADSGMFEAEPTLVEQPAAVAAVATTTAAETSLRGFVSHQALRVAFNPRSDEFGQLLVRPLIEGEQAPAGWVTALLVGLEAGSVVLAGGE